MDEGDDESIQGHVKAIVNQRIEAAGLSDESDPVVVQAVLDQTAAEISEVLSNEDLMPPISLTLSEGKILLGFLGPL